MSGGRDRVTLETRIRGGGCMRGVEAQRRDMADCKGMRSEGVSSIF